MGKSFLIGIHGTMADNPEVSAKAERAIEAALLPLQKDGFYMDRMIIMTGTQEEIGENVRQMRGE